MSGDELESELGCTQIWVRGCFGAKILKITLFLNQLIENQKLYNVLKNQPHKSIWRGDMEFLPPFDLKKVLFLPCLPSKLSEEVEIWYVHLLKGLDAPFEGSEF